MGFLLFIPLLIVIYLILVRPQQQRVRRQRELIMSIDVGDEVVTAGGIIGRIVELSDDRVWVEVADDVVLEVLRVAISRKLEERADLDGSPVDDEEYDAGGGYDESEEADRGRPGDHADGGPGDHADAGPGDHADQAGPGDHADQAGLGDHAEQGGQADHADHADRADHAEHVDANKDVTDRTDGGTH